MVMRLYLFEHDRMGSGPQEVDDLREEDSHSYISITGPVHDLGPLLYLICHLVLEKT